MNVHAHPSGRTAEAAFRDMDGAETPVHAGLPTIGQPALESFERPLVHFSSRTADFVEVL